MSDHLPIKLHPPIAISRDPRQGSALVQWCIAALPLLLLGAMAIEISHWHTTRQRLALTIQRAVDQTSLSAGTAQALKQHLQQQLPTDLRLPMRACITDPTDALMSDFIDRPLSSKLGAAVIRHDHVAQQHRDYIRRGLPGGRGPRSGKTIFQANTLNVEVVIQSQALSPWVRHVYHPVMYKLTHQAIMQSHRRLGPRCVSLP